jgi:hypothetical protein
LEETPTKKQFEIGLLAKLALILAQRAGVLRRRREHLHDHRDEQDAEGNEKRRHLELKWI